MNRTLTYQHFSDGDYYVISSVSTPSLHGQWRAKVQWGRYLVNFKVDSGADVSAISLDDFNKLSPPPKCKPSQVRLVGAANQSLETVGVFAAEMKYKSVTHREQIFVIKGLDDNILSRSACDALLVIEFKGDRNLTLPSPPLCPTQSPLFLPPPHSGTQTYHSLNVSMASVRWQRNIKSLAATSAPRSPCLRTSLSQRCFRQQISETRIRLKVQRIKTTTNLATKQGPFPPSILVIVRGSKISNEKAR
jgi:hypothetical protein